MNAKTIAESALIAGFLVVLALVPIGRETAPAAKTINTPEPAPAIGGSPVENEPTPVAESPPATPAPPVVSGAAGGVLTGHYESRRAGLFGRRTRTVWIPN